MDNNNGIELRISVFTYKIMALPGIVGGGVTLARQEADPTHEVGGQRGQVAQHTRGYT